MDSVERLNTDIEREARELMRYMDLVFSEDWEFSNACLRDDAMGYFIKPGGTFLNPLVDDIGNNWANREGLLDSLNRLRALLGEH